MGDNPINCATKPSPEGRIALQIIGILDTSATLAQLEAVNAKIRAAVEEEREACAKTAEETAGYSDWDVGEEIATEIRARGDS